MALSQLGNVWQIVRQLNLGALRQEAEQPFRLLIAGEVALGTELAERLSATSGREGIHPWLTVAPLPLEQSLDDVDGAILITPRDVQSPELADATRRLARLAVPPA